MLVATPRDDFLTRCRPEGGAVLTSEGVSPSVPTSGGRRPERAGTLVPRSSHPFVRDLLSGLDAGLVEGVDAVEGAGYRGLYFEGLKHVAEVLLVCGA